MLGTLGLALGGYLPAVAAAAGLSAVFHEVPRLCAAVKLIEAAHLVRLGISMIRAKTTGANDAPVVACKTGKRALVEGLAGATMTQVRVPGDVPVVLFCRSLST